MKTFLLFLVLIISFTVTKSFLHTGFPYTHDGENHLARFASYKMAFRQGQIPPRFAPNLRNNYGYPVFNFQYPLANIISLPFTLIRVNPEFTFKLIVILSVAGAGIGSFLLVERSGASQIVSFLSAVLYVLSPFLLTTLIYRGNIGEILAYSLLPWMLLSIYWISEKKVIIPIIIWAMFALSHNLTVMLSIPIILGFAILTLGNKKQLWRTLGLVTIFTVGLTGWFWIPAIAEKKYVNIEQVNLVHEYQEHFITFSQLFFSPLTFGYSNAGPVSGLSFQIGAPILFILLVSATLLVKALIQFESHSRLAFLHRHTLGILSLFAIFILLFVQTSHSVWLWELFPFLKVIQFPWRVSLFIPLFSILLLANLWEHLGRILKTIFLFLLIIQFVITLRQTPIDYFHKELIDYEAFTESTSTQKENTSRTFTYENIFETPDKPAILGNGNATLQKWNGTEREYTLQLSEVSTIIEPTMYFIGWETLVTTDEGKNYKVTYDLDGEAKGRIAYQLPAGQYQVISRFTQKTVPRMLGNALFILSLISLLVLFLKHRRL